MSKKRIVFLVTALLFVVSFVAGYLFYRLLKQEPVLQPATPKIGERKITTYSSDPIKKLDSPEGISYEIEGYFVGDFVKIRTFLEGDFIIRNDPQKRKVKTYLGSGGPDIYLGKYKGSFKGDSRWQDTPTDEVAKLLKSEVPVLIKVDFILDEDPEIKAMILEREATLDSLILDFQENQFDTKIPKDFVISAYRIGIIE